MGKVISVNKSNFEKEVKDYKGTVLVDFWAEWCGPCQVMLPILDKFAEQYKGEVKVCKVNVDEAPELAAQFRIMSIPTIMAFKDGELMGAPKPGVREIDLRGNGQDDLVTMCGLEYKD